MGGANHQTALYITGMSETISVLHTPIIGKVSSVLDRCAGTTKSV